MPTTDSRREAALCCGSAFELVSKSFALCSPPRPLQMYASHLWPSTAKFALDGSEVITRPDGSAKPITTPGRNARPADRKTRASRARDLATDLPAATRHG